MNLLPISEVATKLNVSADAIRRWEKKGLIKTYHNSQGQKEFDCGEIELLIKKLNGESTGRGFQVFKKESTGRTAIDLFAGAGGTALGLENAGFNHVLVNEIDKWAVKTLRVNRPQWNVIEGDIHDLSIEGNLGDLDLVEGGFPCQAFSYAGNRKGFADTRGTLFHEFARIVGETRPKVAMGENVKGLLKHDNGHTLSTMVSILQDLGYKVAYKLLRAQYLDVAQKRERLIILAVRDDLNIPILFPKEKNYSLSLREVISDVPPGPGMEYSQQKYEVMAKVPEGGNWRDLPGDIQRAYMKKSFFLSGGKTGMARRLAWDEPSLTLTCNPAQKQTERCHPAETRPLNVREYARIQSFPDEWNFQGSISQQYKQIGNAVPVNLAYHIGVGIQAMLDGVIPEGYEELET